MPYNNKRTSAHTHRQQILLFDPACFLRQVEDLQEQHRIALYSSFVSALLMASIVLKIAPGHAPLDWLILFTVITGLRVYTGLVRHTSSFTIVTASEWYGLFLTGCFVCGGMWCYMGLSLIPGLTLPHHELVYLHAINILFISGLAAGTMMIYKNRLLPMLAFSFPAILPYAIYLAMQESLFLSILGTLFLMYFLFVQLVGISHVHNPTRVTRPAEHL